MSSYLKWQSQQAILRTQQAMRHIDRTTATKKTERRYQIVIRIVVK